MFVIVKVSNKTKKAEQVGRYAYNYKAMAIKVMDRYMEENPTNKYTCNVVKVPLWTANNPSMVKIFINATKEEQEAMFRE